jgi:hypothetical protein
MVDVDPTVAFTHSHQSPREKLGRFRSLRKI